MEWACVAHWTGPAFLSAHNRFPSLPGLAYLGNLVRTAHLVRPVFAFRDRDVHRALSPLDCRLSLLDLQNSHLLVVLFATITAVRILDFILRIAGLSRRKNVSAVANIPLLPIGSVFVIG